ncbi:MAG: hypothetical protein Q9170_000898 [Blastenia crenularia]
MLLRPLVPFGLGLCTGLNLIVLTDTAVAISAALLLGFLIGVATNELKFQNRRSHVSICHLGDLQEQYQAIEPVGTGFPTWDSPSVIPEFAWSIQEDVVDASHDEGTLDADVTIDRGDETTIVHDGPRRPDNTKGGDMTFETSQQTGSRTPPDVFQDMGTPGPCSSPFNDVFNPDLFSARATQTIPPETSLASATGCNATREPSPGPHYQTITILDEDTDMARRPRDIRDTAVPRRSRSPAPSRLYETPHLQKSKASPRSSRAGFVSLLNPWHFLKGRTWRSRF